MRFRQPIACAAYVSLLGAPFAVLAHHAFAAEFDREQPVEVTGKVSKVEWINPHARFYIDADDGRGEAITWNFELASPDVLMRRGWTPDSLQLGDVVTVSGFRGRNDPHVANAASVTFADGTKVSAGLSSESQ